MADWSQASQLRFLVGDEFRSRTSWDRPLVVLPHRLPMAAHREPQDGPKYLTTLPRSQVPTICESGPPVKIPRQHTYSVCKGTPQRTSVDSLRGSTSDIIVGKPLLGQRPGDPSGARGK